MMQESVVLWPIRLTTLHLDFPTKSSQYSTLQPSNEIRADGQAASAVAHRQSWPAGMGTRWSMARRPEITRVAAPSRWETPAAGEDDVALQIPAVALEDLGPLGSVARRPPRPRW